MALLRARKDGGAPLNTEGMRRPATQRAGAFGLSGPLVSVRGKTSDRQPWGCQIIIKEFDTAGANESSSMITITDAVGDEPKSLPAWRLSADGRILEIPALRLPKQEDRGVACAVPILLRAGVHAIDLTFSKIPSPIPPIGSIVEVTSIVAKASKGYISWNCQELCLSALHARLPAELAIAETIPYGLPCLDLVGPSRIGDFSHTAPQTPMPMHHSDDFPAKGMSRAGGISPVLRLEINRHMPRDLAPNDDARDQRFILPPEGMLLDKDSLEACEMEHLDATTKIEPKIYQRTADAATYGKFSSDLSLVSTFYGADHEPQQTIALVGRRLFAEPFCANAGAAIHPPLWEAFTLPTAPDLKDCLPMMPHHLVVVPDYAGSSDSTVNIAALTEYEQQCQTAMESGRPKPAAPLMQLNTSRVVGYVPRVCEYAHQYGIPVSPSMVKRRFDATGARATEVYSPADLYSNGPNKKFTRESFVKAQMLATGGYDPAKSMDKELFERPWTFQHHVGWVLADWQTESQWIDQILGDERRSADWLWYAFMLAKPESKMPYATGPAVKPEGAEDPLADVRPLPGCTLRTPEEGDAWILGELKERYGRMSEEKRRPFIGKNKNSAPLELLPDWRNIWMQTMADPDVKHTLPIMVFVAVRANTKGMTVLGLKRGRDAAAAVKAEPSAKKFKNEKGEAVSPPAERSDEEGVAADEMELDPQPSQ